MNDCILCIDIDDAIYPTEQTHIGKISDSIDILKINMNRIKVILNTYDMYVFFTSSWSSILSINIDNTISYERERCYYSDFIKKEYTAFEIIRDGVGKRVVGLSCGNRYKDIINLVKLGNVVVSIDDMDLSPEKLYHYGDIIDYEFFEKQYLYLKTYGSITNRHLYKLKNFMSIHYELPTI